MACFACLVLALASASVCAESVQELHAYAGEIVAITGHASPNSSVNVDVTSNLALPVTDGRFASTLTNIHVPDRSRLSLTARPVTSVKASGVVHGTTFSNFVDGSMSGDAGAISLKDLPGGDYDISIYGDSSAGQVSVTITAGQAVTADAAGNYTVYASSGGLPPGLYIVTANSVRIAEVVIDPLPTPSTRPSSGDAGSIGLEQVAYGAFAVALIVMALLAADSVMRSKRKKK